MLPAATWKTLSLDDRARLHLPWPADPGSSSVDYTERRNILCAIRNAEQSLGHLPDDPYDVISCPTISSDHFVCPLDASDDQGVRLDGDLLSIQLPLCENPEKKDWVWHSLRLRLPDFAKERHAAGVPCRPVIRVEGDKVYLLVPLDVPTPERRVTGRTFAVDWGVRKLATGSVVYMVDGEVFTTGRPYHFIGAGFQHRQHDRKDQAQILGDEIRRDEALLRGKKGKGPDSDTRARLTARIAFLRQERDLVWRAFHHANDQYARAAARWIVTCALSEDCDTIAFEELASLQTRDHGRFQNSRDNLQVRGKLLKYTMELAQMVGLNVVTVEPRGTSSRCSRCGRPSKFRHAPDRLGGHANWIACACGRSSDRDHAGSEAIGARSFGASPAKRGRKRKPTPGPASHRPIRVRRESRRACQRTPFPAYAHTGVVVAAISASSSTMSAPPSSSSMVPTPQTIAAITSHLSLGPHPPRPRGGAAPSRVDRGPGVARQPGRPDDLRPRYPTSRTGPPRALALDGLCAGFWHRVRMSRPRAYAAPTADPGDAG